MNNASPSQQAITNRAANPTVSLPGARWRVAGCLGALMGVAFSFCLSARAVKADDSATPEQLLSALPDQLTSEIPPDVDPKLLKEFGDKKMFAEQQLLFDILSWRSFVALCWPVGRDGKPLPKLTDAGTNTFETLINDENVFLPDGQKPKDWNAPRANAHTPTAKPGQRVLRLISAVHGAIEDKVGKKSELAEAFKFPLWDQNGFMVRYEIFLNRAEYDYIVCNGLYSLDGQAAFFQKGKPVNFPSGVYGTKKVGAIEVKLAWKILLPDKGDLPGRFITAEGYTVDHAGKLHKRLFGLVGMHISHKTQTSPQWAWSTFAHVDNLETNALARFEGKPIKPLFFNASNNGQLLPINIPSQQLQPFKDGMHPTQIFSFQLVPPATRQVTRTARRRLRQWGSVLQYYDLLGSQWPTDPSAPPTPPGNYPGSVTNKASGQPTPVYLINPIMETYFQEANQIFGNQEEGFPKDTRRIFGTESCMGCHSSAAIATSVVTPAQGPKQITFAAPLSIPHSADFSWLLQQKAHATPIKK